MTIICYQVFPSDRLLFSFLAEALLSAFSWFYTFVYPVVQKYHEMSFVYNYPYFQYSFYQPVLFAQLENVNKVWNNNHTVHVNERNQNKNKTKSRHIQIDHAFYCSIQPTSNAMVSLKDGFTIQYQSQNEDFLSVIYY